MCTLYTIILLTKLYAMFANQIEILTDGEIVEEETANGLMEKYKTSSINDLLI